MPLRRVDASWCYEQGGMECDWYQDSRMWIEYKVTDGAEDHTASGDPYDWYEQLGRLQRDLLRMRCDFIWNACWRSVQGGTECGRELGSLVADVNEKWKVDPVQK